MITKIKNHVKKNKVAYIAGVGGFAAGAAVVAYKHPKLVSNSINQIASYKPVATLEVHIEALGDPGNIIQSTTDGTVWASQNQAAKALGVSPWAVSKHLKGELSEVGGHVLTKLGKAHVNS